MQLPKSSRMVRYGRLVLPYAVRHFLRRQGHVWSTWRREGLVRRLRRSLSPWLRRWVGRVIEKCAGLRRDPAWNVRDAWDEAFSPPWQGAVPPTEMAARLRAGRLSRAAGEPRVSIIIPVYNQVAFTLQCLDSLDRHQTKYPFEIIVIDDCSRDQTPDLVPLVPGVRYLRNEKNLGFLRSCNRAAQQARGEYLVLLNNDTYVLPHWLDELIGTFETKPSAGLVGSKLIYPDGTLQEAGGIIWSDGSGWNYGRGDDRKKPEYNYVRPVDYCSGAALAIRAATWHELGGFDERFAPAYYEDTDLAFRVRNRGLEVLYQPLAAVVHFEGTSCGRDTSTGIKSHQNTNRHVFRALHCDRLRKHLPLPVDTERLEDLQTTDRVLIIDHAFPTPDQDAGSQVTLETVAAFQELGFQVNFLPINLHWTADARLLQRVGIKCFYSPYVHSLEEYFNKHPAVPYRVIVLFREICAARCLPLIRTAAPDATVFYHTVDLHYLRAQREAALLRDPDKMSQAERTKVRELALVRSADCTIVVSEVERDLLLREIPRARVHCLQFVHEPSRSVPGYDLRRDLVFLGGYRHPPNVDAVLYFVRDIFPLIRQVLPDVRLTILGSHPPAEVLGLAAVEGVDVVGYVPELAPWFEKCRISIAPLRYGAGIKGKVATSLSFGVPCVATTIAAEGMGAENGRELLIADDPQHFASAVVAAYTDKALWQRLSENGLAFVERNYSRRAWMTQWQTMLCEAGVRPPTIAEHRRLRLAA